MQVCWWEYEQLLEHLQSREDIWASASPSLWIRVFSYDDDTPVCSLRISPPKSTGPFRRYNVNIVPAAWDTSICDEYLLNLLRSWTDYGRRQRFETFLSSELNLDAKLAETAAIALCSLDEGLTPGPDPDRFARPTQRELYPDVASPLLCLADGGRYQRAYGLTGGGWLNISLTGGMLRVRASLPSHGRYGGGFSQPFEGFVRPYNGNVELAAASLFGEDMKEGAEPRWQKEEHGQEQLLGSESGGPDTASEPDQGDVNLPEPE